MAQKRILIIEDNPVNMELATDLLEAASFTVLGADNAEEGIHVARLEMPDLVLMDIALPGMDGLTATGILKKDPQTNRISIVALTAHAMKGDEERALAAGCLGYITKPINTRSFSRLVAEFLETPILSPAMIDLEPTSAAQAEAFLAGQPAPAMTEPRTAEPQVRESISLESVSLEPVSLEPMELEPIALEPMALEPIALEPMTLEPIALEAISLEPIALEADTEVKAEHPVFHIDAVPAMVESEAEILEAVKKVTDKKTNGKDSSNPFLLIPKRGRNGKIRETVAIVAETQTAKILVVDDDEFNREVLTAMLKGLGFEAVVVNDGYEALAAVDESFDLILLDVMMPGMDGVETCRRIREEKRLTDLPIIMVTALSSREDQLRAVESGANDWITKPVDRRELTVRVQSHLKFKAAQDALRRHQRDLEATVRAKTADLRRALEQVTAAQQKTLESYMDTMHRLALAAEFRDGFMPAAHIRSVGNYCAAIARGLGLPEETAEALLHASPIHDIGMLSIPDDILRKGEDRTPEEESIYRDHTSLGARLLSGSSSELLRAGEVIALSHHEKWDGSGYPRGLKGEDIPLYGRICAVADFFDTITAYNGGEWQATNEEAREVLMAGRGTDFDPAVVDAFLDRWEEIEMFQRRYRRTEAPPADLLMRRGSR